MTCRICLLEVEPSKGISVFTEWRRNELISDMIMNFAYVEVFDSDDLSKIICPLCLERLKFVYKFKHLIIRSDSQLRRQHKSIKGAKGTDGERGSNTQNEGPNLKLRCQSPAYIKCEEIDEFNESTNVNSDREVHTEFRGHINKKSYKTEENSKENVLDFDIKENKAKTKKVYKCEQCQNTFKSRYNLKVHKTTHTGTLPYKCDVCNKGFILQYVMNVHKRIHSEERPFKCDNCDKSFKSKSVLITHRKIHQGIKPHLCKICGKAFSQLGNLQAHHNVHSKERLVCEVCGKDYSSKRGLDRHLLKIHMNEPNQPCPICGKLYYNLKVHMKTIHSEARTRFPCTVCDKKFASKGVLKIHMRIHDGVKPYSCDICGKSFTQACVATLHKRVHTKETPFACKSCDRQFSYKHHLKKHIEKDHSK